MRKAAVYSAPCWHSSRPRWRYRPARSADRTVIWPGVLSAGRHRSSCPRRRGWPTGGRWSRATARSRWATRTGCTRRAAGTSAARWAACGRHPSSCWTASGSPSTAQWLGADTPAATVHDRLGLPAVRVPAAGGVRRPGRLRAGRRARHRDRPDLPQRPGRTVDLAMDAHSELMPAYPWGWTTPGAADEPAGHRRLRRRHAEASASRAETAHDYAAVVGSSERAGEPRARPEPPRPAGPGRGLPGRRHRAAALRRLGVRQGHRRAAELRAVAQAGPGDHGVVHGRRLRPGARRPPAPSTQGAAKNPAGALRSKVDSRLRAGRQHGRRPAGRPAAAAEHRVEQAEPGRLGAGGARPAAARHRRGQRLPGPAGTLDEARWFGAGFPDYPWLFGTDGEYTAFAAVAAGQFEPIKAHLRALRDISEVINEGSGKLVHEVVSTGDVYFGANDDAGNTDETVKFPSAVALVWRWTGDNAFRDDLYDFTVRNLRYVDSTLDADGDGWLEGLGNVERPGMGEEKLDSTAYYIRGLLDLADLATSQGRHGDRRLGVSRAATCRRSSRRLVGRRRRERLLRVDRRPDRPGERQPPGVPAALDRRDADGDRAARTAPRWRRRATARSRWHSGRSPATRASSGCTTRVPARPPRRRATRARRATAWSRR